MASAQILQSGKALYSFNGTEWIPLNTSGNLVNSTRWQHVASGSETSLSGEDDFGTPLAYTPGFEQVFLNGVLLARDTDYTASNGTSIADLAPLIEGYIVEIVSYNNVNIANTYTKEQIDTKISDTFSRWTKTLSASATLLSGEDDDSNILSYTPGLEKVHINGILLAPEEYLATSGSSVILDEAGVENDIIQIHTLKNFRIANHYTINQSDELFIPDSILDAKGDILTATADNTPAKLTVGTNGHVLVADSGETTGLKWNDPGSVGKILQVVQGSTSTEVLVTGTTLTDIGLSLSITPSKSTSKILILFSVHLDVRRAGNAQASGICVLLRNSTTIHEDNNSAPSFFINAALANNFAIVSGRCSVNIVDSPNTTSPITYKVQGRSAHADGIAGFQRANPTSYIIAMEVSE